MGRCHKPWLILDASEMVRHYCCLLGFLSLGNHSSSSRCVQVGLSVMVPTHPKIIHHQHHLSFTLKVICLRFEHMKVLLCVSPVVASLEFSVQPLQLYHRGTSMDSGVRLPGFITPSVNSYVALRNSLNFFNNLNKLVFVTCLNSDQLHKCLV